MKSGLTIQEPAADDRAFLLKIRDTVLTAVQSIHKADNVLFHLLVEIVKFLIGQTIFSYIFIKHIPVSYTHLVAVEMHIIR